MNIAILGAGRMGSAVGAFLKAAGDQVILVDPNTEHIEQINARGLELQINDQPPLSYHFDGGYTSYAGLSAQDAVILLTSGNATDAVIREAMGTVIGPETYVITFQNGLGHTEKLQAYVDIDHILYGMVKLGGWLLGPGKVRLLMHPGYNIVIGSVRQAPSADAMARTIAEHLTAGGVITEFHSDIETVVWEKVLNNCSFNPLCALSRSNMRNAIAGEHGRPILIQVVKEVVAVANAKGIPLSYEKAMDSLDHRSLVNMGDHFPSMTYDVREKRKTEVDFLNGTISRYGKELGIPTPMNDTLTLLIKALEDGYETGF